MKILHVNKFFDLRGGAEAYMQQLMERQRADGHDVHAFSTRSPQNLPTAQKDAARFVERFDYAKREGMMKDARKGIAFLWNREARLAMQRAIREIRPDVIHLHNIYHHLSSSILGPIRASGIPCIQTLHDYKLACPNYKMFTEGAPCERCKGGHYAEAIKHRCLSAGMAENVLAAMEMGFTKLTQSYERTVRMFICPSEFMSKKMEEWGEPPSKMTVIPNCVEAPDDLAPRDGRYVLFAGRISPEKGIETLIRAVARVRELRLHIAGTGPEEARLKMLCESLGASNVVWLGFLRKPELARELAHARAFAVPSVWYENAPLAVLEAMAVGLPILASRIGGLPELVQHGKNGYTIEPGNVDAWTEALRTFSSSTQSTQDAMALVSRELALQRYGWKTHVDALMRTYRSIGVPS